METTALLAMAAVCLTAQTTSPASRHSYWATLFAGTYRVVMNVVYLTANNYPVKLDVYARRDGTPEPTLIWIHGGGWLRGSKDVELQSILPWLEKGWNVVNVDYRLGKVSGAPAAVVDCQCALRWVAANARQYGLDLNRLVVSGESAGGHLALTTGMIPESAGFGRECPGPPLPRVAAIIDWFGITDVNELLEGAGQRPYAVEWLGSRLDREELARKLSPLTWVQKELPPVLMIHGDADTWVPYRQSVRLHEALDRAGVDNRLVTIPGGSHGGFPPEQRLRAFGEIDDFLARHHLTN